MHRASGSPSDPRLGGRALNSIVYDEAAIVRRVGELGAEITDSYPDGDLLVVGLLKGSVISVSDLVRAIRRLLQIDFLAAASCGSGTTLDGTVRPGV